jgi:hypothetical protein
MYLAVSLVVALWIAISGCAIRPSANVPVNLEVADAWISPTPETIDTFVKDEQKAIEIALKSWIPIYGQQAIVDEKPFVAKLSKDVWHVHGSLPQNWDGGVAEAWISQKNGRVIKVAHGK